MARRRRVSTRHRGSVRIVTEVAVVVVTVIALIVVATWAVARRPGPAAALVDEAGERIGRAEVALDADNGLRGQLRLRGVAAAVAVVEIRDGAGAGWRLEAPMDGADAEVPVLALRPGTRYLVEVTLEDVNGVVLGRTAQPVGLRTRALPGWLRAVRADGRAAAPGLTLFDAAVSFPEDAEGAPDFDGAIVAVDERGTVVWYQPELAPPQDIELDADGDLVYVYDEISLRERTPTGELVREWTGAIMRRHRAGEIAEPSIPVETDMMHHEVDVLEDGNLLTLSREVAEVGGFTRDLCGGYDGADGTYRIGSDVVVEIAPDSGEVAQEWSLLDHLDPSAYEDRLRDYELCSGYLDVRYPDRAPVRDWSHANGIAVDEARNLLWVSARHLDQLVALRYRDDAEGAAGELVWTLGVGGDFALEEGEWFYHQHAPSVLPDGTILLYDNGNERPGTSLDDPADLPYSRAVVYDLDEQDMTARQVWEHRLPPEPDGDPVYAPYVGDADSLGDTVLIAHGGLLDPPAHDANAPDRLRYGRIVEVDRATGEVAFDLTLRAPDDAYGWRTYRAERVADVYPTSVEATRLPPD